MAKKSKEKLSLYWLARTKPYPMVVLSGILLVLSFPPFKLAFLAYVAFVPLLLVMDHTPDKVFEDRIWGFLKAVVVILWRFLTLQFIWRYKRKPWIYKRQIISRYAQIFRYSYTTFLIWNFGCCYWLMLTALGVSDPGEQAAALAAGLMANLLNPFLMAIPIYLFARVRKLSTNFWLSLSFVPFWLTFEWLHFHWELSWSWLTLGHSQTFFPAWIQYTEFTGTLGISAHILMVNILAYQLVRAVQVSRKEILLKASGLLVIVGLPFVINPIILNPERPVFQASDSLNVRLIQPNIDPYDKFQGATNRQQIDRFVSLIREPGLDTIDLVVLPETALPRAIWRERLRNEELIQPLWAIILEENISLLTGLTEIRYIDPRFEPIPPSAHEYERDPSGKVLSYYEYYNASALLRQDTVPQTFQKGKLVPMVERMPYLEYLTFLKEYNIDLGGNFGNYGKPPVFSPLEVHTGAKIASLVCYESEYGDYIRPLIQQGASLITVVTNDGWWNFDNSGPERKGSSGHIQHAHLSVLRAIEARREVARSANTGISMFVDVRGEIHQDTEYWVPTYVDRTCALYEAQTFYVRYGDYIGWIAALISLALIAWVAVSRDLAGRRSGPLQKE